MFVDMGKAYQEETQLGNRLRNVKKKSMKNFEEKEDLG
jgi:hypothetical protein